MAKKLFFAFVISAAFLVSCNQSAKENDTKQLDVAVDPLLSKYKKYITVSSNTADTINRYYIVYTQIIGSGEIFTIKLNNGKQLIGSTKDNDFKFKIWLSEKDEKTGKETGYESNTIPISLTATEYSKSPTAHIELKEYKIVQGQQVLSTRATKPPSNQIIIDAGHPFD